MKYLLEEKDKISKRKEVFEKEMNAKLSESSDTPILQKMEYNELQNRLNAVLEEKEVLSGHITRIETMLLKRGQTDQTIFFNKPKEFKCFEIREG